MIVLFGALIVIASIFAVVKRYSDRGFVKIMSKTPFIVTRHKHKDVEFLTDDEDDIEQKPNVSKPNNNAGNDSKSQLQNIPKYGKRKGFFDWDAYKSGQLMGRKKIMPVKMENKPMEVFDVTDDETDESFSPKKENVQNNFKLNVQPGLSTENDISEVKMEAPQVIIHHRLMISKVSVDFPVRPYPCQTAVMSMLIKGCTNKQNCLLESPTGSGKTLALLCSSLAWQNNFAPSLKDSLNGCGRPEIASPEEIIESNKILQYGLEFPNQEQINNGAGMSDILQTHVSDHLQNRQFIPSQFNQFDNGTVSNEFVLPVTTSLQENSSRVAQKTQSATAGCSEVSNDTTIPITSQSAPTNATATDITGLRAYLSADFDGLAILSSYQKFDGLVPRVRESLVHKIIKREEENAFRTCQAESTAFQFIISPPRFEDITSDIISLFPSETRGTYFAPFKTVKTNGVSTRINASGKLYEHFQYRKGVLMEAGVITSIRKAKVILNITTSTARAATASDEDKLVYIAKTIDPNPQLFQYWNETRPARKYEFDEGKIGIGELFQKYRCLQMQFGAELLKLDFDYLYPNKSETFFTRWPLIRSRLVELLQGTRMPKKGVYCALVQELKHLLPDEQDAIVLYLLPTLMKPKHPGRSAKNVEDSDTEVPAKKQKRIGKAAQKTKSRASEPESQEAFFIVVPTAAGIEAAVKIRKQDLHKRDLSIQFLPVFVGTLEKVESSYVYIDTNIIYRVQSPMHAIDLTLKLFYALDCEYPLDAAHVWLFIQQIGFCIVNPLDKFSVSMNTLKGEIEKVLPG